MQKYIILKNTYLLILMFFAMSSNAQENLLWYNQPSNNQGKASWLKESLITTDKENPDKVWEDYALPIGNGVIGAMIFGGIEEERIQFNEKSVWDGGPNVEGYHSANRNDAWESLPEIRGLLLAGKIDESEAMAMKNLTGLYEKDEEGESFFGSFQTFGELYFKIGI